MDSLMSPTDIKHHCYITKCSIDDNCELCVAKAQNTKTRKSIYAWGNEKCPEHSASGYTGGNWRLRKECPLCWEELTHSEVKPCI